jgi:hypothetical protein
MGTELEANAAEPLGLSCDAGVYTSRSQTDQLRVGRLA